MIYGHSLNAAPSPEQIRLPDGFKIELLYSVPRDDQGSWVAMCQDDKGRLIVSDQHGGIYRFPFLNWVKRLTLQSISRSPIQWSGQKLEEELSVRNRNR
jgi:hypothetical protein